MEYLPPKEVCKRVPIGQRRLYGLVRDNKIPHVKLGKRILVRPESVQEWLRSQEVGVNESEGFFVADESTTSSQVAASS